MKKSNILIILIFCTTIGVYFSYVLSQRNDQVARDQELDFNIEQDDQYLIQDDSVEGRESQGRASSVLDSELPSEGIIDNDVPFVVQAPFGNWDNPIFQDACEEASLLMAMEWARGNGSISNQEAVSEIEAMAQLEESLIGTYVDTSVADVMKLVSAYYDYGQVEAFEIQSPRDIIERINRGEIVVVPTNGQRLNNPFYTPPGPERHSLVIRGYDFDTEEFITNDPGTRRGEAYRYDKNVLFGAIGDYPTGDHKPYVEPLEKRGYSIWR